MSRSCAAPVMSQRSVLRRASRLVSAPRNNTAGLYRRRREHHLVGTGFPEPIEGTTMITAKDRMTAEFAVDAERRRDLARVDAGAQANKPIFPKKTSLPATEEHKGGRSYAPTPGGFIASRSLAKTASGKAARPAAHGHSRHK